MEKAPLRLWLAGYLTPSLNELLGKNYWILTKQRERARRALLCALVDSARSDSIRTTPSEAQNSLLINSAIAALSRETVLRKSRSSSARLKPSTKPKVAPWLKSSIPPAPSEPEVDQSPF